MTRRLIGAVAVALVVALTLVWWWRRPMRAVATTTPAVRIVSLTPALTETLFAIGAGAEVVGVSDWCDFPPEAATRPRVGSAISPSYERIVAQRPTLIFTERSESVRFDELSRVAPTHALPWLSLSDIVASTEAIGRLVGRTNAAEALAQRLRSSLGRRPSDNAARVLLALRYGAGTPTEVMFIREDSIHGNALAAAGYRNAVTERFTGVPQLSLERVIALDPDFIIVLTGAPVKGEATRQRVEAEWSKLSVLRAVKERRVGVVIGAEAYSNGPRILELPGKISEEISRLRAAR